MGMSAAHCQAIVREMSGNFSVWRVVTLFVSYAKYRKKFGTDFDEFLWSG